MKKEIWKPIKNYEGIYEVSNFGMVRSLDRISSNGKRVKAKHLKLCAKSDGYIVVGLYKNGRQKTSYVHKLVADAFIPRVGNKTEINHIDGNKKNNRVSNIEWSSRSENIKHAYETGLKKPNYAKLNEVLVMEIKAMINEGKTNVKISEIYNVSESTISNIKKRKNMEICQSKLITFKTDSIKS